MLVMRAYLVKAVWNIDACADKGVTFCDADGKLCMTAVAGSKRGCQLAELLTEGIECEVLSWKMDVEEPTAAGIISRALNRPQEMSMRTSELSAIATLNGEIIALAGPDLGQKVAWASVRDRLRHIIGHTADDPDLPDFFRFVDGCWGERKLIH